jgi:hypothetical protein
VAEIDPAIRKFAVLLISEGKDTGWQAVEGTLRDLGRYVIRGHLGIYICIIEEQEKQGKVTRQ